MLRKGDTVLVIYPVVETPTEGIFLGISVIPYVYRVLLNGSEKTVYQGHIQYSTRDSRIG